MPGFVLFRPTWSAYFSTPSERTLVVLGRSLPYTKAFHGPWPGPRVVSGGSSKARGSNRAGSQEMLEISQIESGRVTLVQSDLRQGI